MESPEVGRAGNAEIEIDGVELHSEIGRARGAAKLGIC